MNPIPRLLPNKETCLPDVKIVPNKDFEIPDLSPDSMNCDKWLDEDYEKGNRK